ncbi:hypothetical protein [uncultured Legionella sp.]|uniref:hypothetical protein n=1 Tax=uncultured Legionella sp. TaxID=210934 RepID=UPI002606C16F|nr:hypothetical protein [uncultured Legionella sp.]
MKAINQEGQKIIDESISVRETNKLLIIDKIRTVFTCIKLNNIDSAEQDIFDAYELIQQSLHNTFICVDGLMPLVLNEICDSRNHNKLYDIGERLYRDVCMKIPSLKNEKYEGLNIISFQRARIKRIMEDIYYDICLTEPLDSLI